MEKDRQSFYDESCRLIRKAMAEHTLVLFVGSGLSLNAGMPSWSSAVTEIASKLGMTADSSNMLKVPQYYYNVRGKKDYTALMREIFKFNSPLKSQPVHDQVIAFDAKTIITTNYDHLIEQAAEKNGEVRYVVSNDSELPYKHGKELIKMHGDFEHDNFVLKEEDYLNYQQNFKLISNYIVSLAGTSTILFVGYSFNDPDVKRIFSWLKDALNENLQRAYMISLESYNEITTSYLKNFGVNVIWGKELYPEEADKTHLLEKVLDWILNQKETLLDKWYGELGPYQYLNAAYDNDVHPFLHDQGFTVGQVLCTDEQNEQNTVYELSNRMEIEMNEAQPAKAKPAKNSALFEKLCYAANRIVKEYPDQPEIQNLEWYQRMEKSHLESSEEYDKLKVILSVLPKTGIYSLGYYVSGNKKYNIPLSNRKTAENKIEEAIDYFDFAALEQLKKEKENWIFSQSADRYMELAHVNYFLGNYVKAYSLLKEAAAEYYVQPNYAKYFIAKCDQSYIGRKIIQTFFLGEVSKKEKEMIKKECSQLDLDQIFYSIPNLAGKHFRTNNKNGFLKELYSFNLVYELFLSVAKDAQKTKEEADTSYILYFGEPKYKVLQRKLWSFYQYQQKNHFLIEDFKEVRDIYRVAVSALFHSVLAEDKLPVENDITPNALKVGNVHEEALQPFDILLTIRFLSADELRRVLGDKTIKVSQTGMRYLQKVIKNLEKQPKETRWIRNYFYTALTLCGHTCITVDIAKQVFRNLNLYITHIDHIYKLFDGIREFLYNIHKQKLVKQDNELISMVENFIDQMLNIFSESDTEHSLGFIIDSCRTCFMLLEDCNFVYCNHGNINKIINSNVSDTDKAYLFASLYHSCNEKIQQVIEKWFSEWSPAENFRDYTAYVFCVQKNVLNMDARREKQIFHLLKISCKKEKEKQKREYDNKAVNLLYRLVGLAIDGKINQKDELKRLCIDYSLNAAVWLLDVNDETAFSKFNSHWLELVDGQWLQKIADNPERKKKIAEHMRRDYLKGKLDEGLVKIYFKYFF